MNPKNLIRKALRIKGKILETERRHGKNPLYNFTYYGGFDLGYLKGQISILEEVISEDEFNEFLEKEKYLINSFNNSTLRKLKRDKINKILKDGMNMKIKILICGLPGSGKTTLAENLQKELGYAWFNADKVREQFDDWDFSPEGRKRQAQRMFNLCDGLDKNCIADFVAPTEELRKIFNPDIIIWMDTIKESKYTDTNKIFEEPNANIVITDFSYDIEDIILKIKEIK